MGEENTMSAVEPSVTSNPRAGGTESGETQQPQQRNGDGLLKDACEIDRTFPRSAFISVAVYCLLIFCTYRCANVEEWEYLEGGEKQAAVLAFVVLLVTILLQTVHIYVGSEATDLSGILVAAMAVMMVAMTTNGIMAFGPTIVTFDKVTNARYDGHL